MHTRWKMHEIDRFYSLIWAMKIFEIIFIVWRGTHRQFLGSPIMGLRWPIFVEKRPMMSESKNQACKFNNAPPNYSDFLKFLNVFKKVILMEVWWKFDKSLMESLMKTKNIESKKHLFSLIILSYLGSFCNGVIFNFYIKTYLFLFKNKKKYIIII